ncbi:chromate transporter [Paenibacillus piri]|uniref:Chromate transporter n=1 Tax=Paenibacillus piri TaxID=2547395 RepID=A0A4R5KPB4_9BACL|nr:chromate transporter [Paenibacillus piri]TDF97549.1 chromate transporter [Paenibacillus piri]
MKITEKKHAQLLWHIFVSFCKISPISFGGGYAMIPVIEKEVVEQRKWMDSDEMNDVLSIAGSSPGGIAVNAATLTGFRLAGLPGALAAVLGISLPNFIIMLALTIGYAAVQNLPKVTAAFEGIHAAVVGFIAVAGWRMWRSAVYDRSTQLIFIGAVAALLLTHLHPAVLLIIGTVIGVMLYKWQVKLGKLAAKEDEQDKAASGHPPIVSGQYIWGDGI